MRGRREAKESLGRGRREQQRGRIEAEKRKNRGRERTAFAAVWTIVGLFLIWKNRREYKKQVLKLKVKAAETKLC